MKAMAPDPELRYATAREFADDLAAFRRGRAGARPSAEDLDATRRTFRRPTRRTMPRGAPGARRCARARPPRGGRSERGGRAVAWPRSAAPEAAEPRLSASCASLAALVLAGVSCSIGWVAISGYRLYRARPGARAPGGNRADHRPRTRSGTSWTELSEGHSSSWLLRGPRNAGEAEVRRGGRPRDRHLPQRRAAVV